MMRVERDRAFVVQDRLPEIPETEPRVAQIVEQIGAPCRNNEILVTVDRLLETSFAIVLIRLGERRKILIDAN